MKLTKYKLILKILLYINRMCNGNHKLRDVDKALLFKIGYIIELW